MSRETVQALRGPVETSFDLLEKFIADCPDELWAAKKGGWPLWQQIYHAVGAVDFFIGASGAGDRAPLAPPAVGSLEEVAVTVVSKADIKAALVEVRGKAGRFLDGLADADLSKRNEALFDNAKLEMSLAGTVSMLAAHNLYHLGGCDAALRDQGLPGIF